MLSSVTSKISIVATSLSLGLIVLASAASADVGWVIQPSSVLGATARIHFSAFDTMIPGTPDPNSDTYVPPIDIKSVPATDPGTSGDPALGAKAVNSLIGRGTGTFKTVGNTFTSSLDFGKGPADPTFSDLTVIAANIGDFFPSQIIKPTPGSAQDPVFIGGQPVYDFGTAMPANNAAKLETVSPLTGYNALTSGGDFADASRDNGRMATYGLKALPVSDAPIPVTAGSFDLTKLAFYGTVGASLSLALAADPDAKEGLSPQSLVLTPEATGVQHVVVATEGSTGSITRGGGPGVNTGPDYILTAPLFATLVVSHNADGSEQLALDITVNLVSKANLVQGDTNFDGVVDIQDITQMANNWLQHNAQHLGNGDANGDGVVDIQDITMAANHWLQISPPLGGGGGGSITAVPEPGSLLLLGCGIASSLLIVRRRARR
jgi:hypothetical protein